MLHNFWDYVFSLSSQPRLVFLHPSAAARQREIDWPAWDQVFTAGLFCYNQGDRFVCINMAAGTQPWGNRDMSYMRESSVWGVTFGGICCNLLFIFSLEEIKPSSYSNNIAKEMESHIWLDLIAHLTPGSEGCAGYIPEASVVKLLLLRESARPT